MTRIFENKLLKYLLSLMILVEGFLFLLLCMFYMDTVYVNKVRTYPRSAISIELKTIPRDKSGDTFRFMEQFADEYHAFYIRTDYMLDNDGFVNGLMFGVAGDVSRHADELRLDFVGQNVINEEKLGALLSDPNEQSTLGLESASAYRIGDIPTFVYGTNIVFKKLKTVVQDTGTINGQYRVIGLEPDTRAIFLDGISRVSGVSSDVFFDGKSGHVVDGSLREMILWGLFGINSVVLVSLLTAVTISHLQNLGKLILQGWSRLFFARRLYEPLLRTACIAGILFIPVGLALTHMKFRSAAFLSFMVGIGIVYILFIVVLFSISSIFIFIVSPIQAIRERFPKRVYLFVACAVYFIFNVLLIGLCSYIDGPYREVKNNIVISKKWDQVSDYRILSRLLVGQDAASFNRQSKELLEDFRNWYGSIADDPDVYVVHTSYISQDLLNAYRAGGTYRAVPKEAFWEFTVSPGYLSKMDIEVDNAWVEKARSGVRVFLIPENRTEQEQQLLREMITERDTRSIRSDDIRTVFNEKQEFAFVTYKPKDESLFSWSTKFPDLPARDPVILISTPENMIFRESESLLAVGLENSYLKFDGKAAEKYVNPTYLSQFHLDDNGIELLSVGQFVDGVQKNLWRTIQLFVGMLIGITFIVVVLLVTIMLVYQNTNQEKISIKKFLGYSSFRLYKLPVCILILVNGADMAAVVLKRSNIGVFYVGIVIAIELVLFYFVLMAHRMKKVNAFLKS